MNAITSTQANVEVTVQAISADMAAGLSSNFTEANKAIFVLERLEEERLKWEMNELTASRQRLYGMLTDCYEFYLTMKTDTRADVREQMKKGLETFIQVRGYKFQSTSHDMNKIVKSVFGLDRRRVSAYSLALRAALKAGGIDTDGKVLALGIDELAGWIERNGGIEEIRLGSKNQGLSLKDRAEKAKQAIEKQPVMTISPDDRVMAFDTNDSDKLMVLLATYRPSGALEISGVVKSDTAVRAALAALYSSSKGSFKSQEQEDLQAISVETTQQAIERAVAAATLTA
jgi:hypothetical protein